MPKKLKERTPWVFFSTYILSQNSLVKKKFRKKSRTMPKETERGTLYSRPVMYDTQKKGILFGSVSGSTGTI